MAEIGELIGTGEQKDITDEEMSGLAAIYDQSINKQKMVA